MNDGQHLLWAILDEPEVDLHRLVYADWLEENGQSERAEFIRLQIQIHNECLLSGGLYSETDQYQDDLRRVRELYKAIPFPLLDPTTLLHAVRLTHEGLRKCELPVKGLLQRGFISEIHCTLADWLTHGEQIMALHPVERVVTEKKPQYKDIGSYSGPAWFSYAPGVLFYDAEDLPRNIWDRLERFQAVYGWWKVYNTEQAALDALNAVLVGEWRKREQESRKIAYVIGGKR